jgi:hypothetical protein
MNRQGVVTSFSFFNVVGGSSRVIGTQSHWDAVCRAGRDPKGEVWQQQ